MYGRLSPLHHEILDAIRPNRVSRHEGNHFDFLGRHQDEAELVAEVGRAGLKIVAPYLCDRVSDERTLRCALDHLEVYGGRAPGPDGLRFDDLDTDSLKWQCCRYLRDELRSGAYRPGPERVVLVPKGAGRGDRPLIIQNILDRIVQRAAVSILQPLLDPRFYESSSGYRPGRHRLHALALAEKLFVREERSIWLAEDIKDAFLKVPLPRLLQLVQRYFLSADLTELVGRLLAGASTPGLRQGGSLSPLLLNLYLHHFLDTPWRKQHPDLALIRVADDLLVPCRSVNEARRAHDSLVALLTPAGMPLKGDRVSAVQRLTLERPALWLGFRIDSVNGELRYRIAEHGWERLDEALRLAHLETDPSDQALQVIKGWLGQMAPCAVWENDRDGEALTRVQILATNHGFGELLQQPELRRLWDKAHNSWNSLRWWRRRRRQTTLK